MAWIEVYSGQRSLAFQLTILSFYFGKWAANVPWCSLSISRFWGKKVKDESEKGES